jgi:hypothetical protein
VDSRAKQRERSVRITRVDVTVSEEPVRHQFRWRAGLPGSGATNFTARLTIDTDEGVSGVAYASHGRILADLVDQRLREPLIGANPLMKKDLWERRACRGSAGMRSRVRLGKNLTHEARSCTIETQSCEPEIVGRSQP